MRTVVVGAAGQLGRDLVPRLPGEVIPTTRQQADLANATALAAFLADVRPTRVVNCAAYNLVDKAEADPLPAFETNAHGVATLAKLCGARDIQLVHFSTDYVFGLDAARSTPWEVTDAPGPVSKYGLSKLAGEYAVRAHCERHVVIRTCGLYGVWGSGGKGGNFVETMLKLAAMGKSLKVVADQRCTPSYTVDVAETTVALLATGTTGLFQVTNAGQCSWHELAAAIFAEAGVTADLQPTTSADYNAAARRPAYSVLSLAGLRAVGVGEPRHWREALRAYLAERAARC